MKLTRHNGRSGKHGTYNPRHNDRRFDVENSEHIDAERARQNVYWDCYRGFTTHDFRENPEQPDFSFEEIERMYYYEHYADHVNAQNARNEKTRHIERNRTVDDLLKNNKTCPEESIYQIGTMEESVPPETLALIVSEFYEEFENRFGSHIHILDWALHLDEGTPHIHERHVFDCENRYGELCPQQEKALEELTLKIEDVETLLEDVSGAAYDKAVEVVTDKVREQTQLEDMEVIEKYRKSVVSPNAKNSPEVVKIANTLLSRVREKLQQSAEKVLKKVQAVLLKPEVKQAGKEQIKNKARKSIKEKLAQGKLDADRENRERWEREGRIAPTRKQDMEL